LDAEAGVKLRSPKGCAAAHGLDACIRVQHPFMPAGDTSHPNQINPIKNPLDSEHGIYRDHQRPPKILLLSSRDVFKVSRLGHYNCRILIVGVGMQRCEFSPDRPAVNSAGWSHSA
jgi:hypothetical protein